MNEVEANKVENDDDNKTLDKNQIEAEEKQLMLKIEADKIEFQLAAAEEKTAAEDDDGPVKTALSGTVTNEGREVKPKFIPIGAIKMPGFFTRNSDKEKVQKQEEEGTDIDNEKVENERPRRHRLQFLHTCPFTQFLHHPRNQDNNTSENADNSRISIVDRIRLPLNNMLKKNSGKDPEAALASMETLEDKVDTNNDGMENIKLDGDEVDEGKVATKLPLKERIRQRRFIIDDIVVCVVALLVLLAVIVGVMLGAAGPPAQRPLRAGRYLTALTGCGRVEGIRDEGVYKFYGIPYAVPPVGDRRFTYAKPLDNISMCWNDTLPAHRPAPLCNQFLENGTIVGQEDCLTLDVVTPHVRYDTLLPVIVLVGADTLYGGPGPLEPSALYAQTKEVVFVRPNFRLGAFGFLALDVLAKDNRAPVTGNYGLSDLAVALLWVNRTINQFGGDPASVTLLGHRAGATLVAALTTVKKVRKLYTRAWLSSPSVIYPGEPLEMDASRNELFLQRSKCTDAACLRRMSELEVMTATPDVWLEHAADSLPGPDERQRSWLVLDGDLLRVQAYDAWAEDRRAPPLVFSTASLSADSPRARNKHAQWIAEDVDREFEASVLTSYNGTAALYPRTYEGLAALTSAVRTLCPLVSLARMRLGAPLLVAEGRGAADVRAILGSLTADTPELRRFVNAMQHQFYYFVWHGSLPSTNPLLWVSQDAAARAGLPACDTLIQKDVVPRFARVD